MSNQDSSIHSNSNNTQDAPELLQQLTEGLHNFIDSISIAFSPNVQDQATTQQQQQQQQSKSISKQNSFNSNLNSSSTAATLSAATATNKVRRSISPPRGDTIVESKDRYPKEILIEMESKRKSIIEQLNSVSFNLDQQKDDDPISYIKNRMELAKIKSSLESELKQLDEILQTESKFEEPITTTIDSITSLFTLINSTPQTPPNQLNNNSNANIQQFNGNTLISHHHNIHGTITQTTTTTSTSTTTTTSTSSSQHSQYPGLIVPLETPLNSTDPNKPRFPIRDNIKVKLYVDCDEYFAAAAQAIENANREVFLTAWFLSPEVYLVRYPTLDSRYRLDNLLKRKAMQGVKIFIILWDETKIATFKGSKRAKDKLEELHQNIKVIKHPPIIPIYWSHHQKTLIVDQEIAFVGGVDFCFGRYDTWSHHLIDVKSQLWTGKDYYNPVLGDMGDILSPFEDSIDRMKVPRMPWHDVMIGVNGMAARDVALNFILRWNHHKDDYYPQVYYNITPLSSNGHSSVQLLRSMDEWSGGQKNERSIHHAYVQAIEDADHYIYIENQNFVSSHAPGVWNQISFEIVKRIKRAIRKKEVFRVFIVIPSQQDGKFAEETHIRGLMHWQFTTISRASNEGSILSTLKKEFPETDLSEYIGFYSLRTHACLEGTYVTEQIYVHSKFMIIDDRVIIVGSANINDRSLNGERDSEIAFIMRNDNDLIDTKMNGKDFKASRTAFNFRLRLMKEHLGLLPFIEHPEIGNNNISHSVETATDNTNNNVNNEDNDNSSIGHNNNINISSNEIDLQKLNLVHIPTSKSHHRSSSFQGINSIIPGRIASKLETSPIDSPNSSPRNKLQSSQQKESSVIIEDYESTTAQNLSKSPPSNFSLLTISHNTLLNNKNRNNNYNNNNNNNNNNIKEKEIDEEKENGNTDTEDNSGTNDIKVVISETGSPKPIPRSVSSLHDYTNESYCKSSNIDLTDPICSDFYFGVWVATAASNTRIYDMVFPAIPKNSIKTCEQFLQQTKIPVSSSDTRLLSEVRGNLIYHPLDFLCDENLQPNFLFTDDLFQ